MLEQHQYKFNSTATEEESSSPLKLLHRNGADHLDKTNNMPDLRVFFLHNRYLLWRKEQTMREETEDLVVILLRVYASTLLMQTEEQFLNF